MAGDTAGNGKADGGGFWSAALVSGAMPGVSGSPSANVKPSSSPNAMPSASASASSGY